MLPGFRFLFGAIVLSVSMLMFGLGAAALLRAAHQEFSSMPSRRPPQETVLVRNEAVPALAMLRADTPEPERSVPDSGTGNDVQAAVAAADQSLPAAAEAETAVAESENVAAVEDVTRPAEDAPPSNAPEVPVAEPAQQAESSLQIEMPSPAVERETAAADQTSPAVGVDAKIAETRVVARALPPTGTDPPRKIERRSVPKKRPTATIKKSAPKKVLAARRKISTRPQIARAKLQRPPPFAPPFGGWDNHWPGQAGKT
jgi:hypothetical protein